MDVASCVRRIELRAGGTTPYFGAGLTRDGRQDLWHCVREAKEPNIIDLER